MSREKVTAIVLAAGRGNRMNFNIRKQYLELLGRPMICYTLDAFEASSVDEIILMVGPGEEDFVRETIVEAEGYKKVRKIVTGGRQRHESVYLGLETGEPEGYVLIHDGARAFITPELVDICIESVKKYKACIMAMPVKDTIKIVDRHDTVVDTPERKTLWQMQTPQCFVYDEILQAFRKLIASGDQTGITDDGMVMEKFGSRKIRLVRGSYENIKITTQDDLVYGEAILRARMRDQAGIFMSVD